MSAWHRAAVDTICGLCGVHIAVGEPVHVFELPGVRFRRGQKVRCATCDGPAPPDLPPLVLEREPSKPFAMTRFTPGMLPMDWKTAAAGAEREPGEEG